MCMNSVALASWDRLSTTALHCLEGRVVDVMDREVSWIQSVEGIFNNFMFEQVKRNQSKTIILTILQTLYLCDTIL